MARRRMPPISVTAPATGAYTLYGDCDGVLSMWIDETRVIDKGDHRRRDVQGTVELTEGQSYRVRVDYVHRVGAASNHLAWSGPGFRKQLLQPDGGGGDGLPGSR